MWIFKDRALDSGACASSWLPSRLLNSECLGGIPLVMSTTATRRLLLEVLVVSCLFVNIAVKIKRKYRINVPSVYFDVMGLLSILKKVKEKEKEIRVLMLGLDNAGKTTILKKFMGQDITEISPTLGFDIQTLEYKDFKLNVWDVGGQQTIRSYWRNYFEQTDGIVWVVDSADRRRLDDCKRELTSLLTQEKLAGATLLIFANKQDLPGALSSAEIADALGLRSAQFSTRHWSIISCSAVTGSGLVDGIDWLVGDVASRIFLME